MRKPIMAVILCVMAMLCGGFASHAQTREDVLGWIKEAESKFDNAEVEFQFGQYAKKEDVGKVDPFPMRKGNVLMKFGPKPTYKATTFGRSPWDEGPEGIHSGWWSGSYDRKYVRTIGYFDKDGKGDSNNKPARGMGNIFKEHYDDEWYGETLFGTLEYTLPGFRGVGLSQYLEEAPKETPEWKVIEAEPGGLVKIWFPDHDYTYEIGCVAVLDFSRSGNIVEFHKWHFSPEEGGAINEMVDLQLEQRDGLWVPAHFGIKYYDPRQPYQECSMDWKRVNAELTDADFVLQFPEGMTVSDEVAGTVYQVKREHNLGALIGETPDSVEEQVRGSGNTTSASAVRRRGLEKPDDASSTPGKQWVIWLVAGAAAFIIAAFALLVRRLRRRKSTSG